MDFLSEYYLWFIIGGIILVMAVIGYIADKTDFGRKNKIADTNNKFKEEKGNDIIGTPITEVEQASMVNDVIETPEIINNESVQVETPKVEDVSDIIIEEQSTSNGADAITIEEPIIEEEIKIEENSFEQPIMNDISTPLESKEVEIKEVIDESAYVLNNDLSSFAASTNNEFVKPVSDSASNVVDDVINDQDSDDDIWKF